MNDADSAPDGDPESERLVTGPREGEHQNGSLEEAADADPAVAGVDEDDFITVQMSIPTGELRAVLEAWRAFSLDDERHPHGNVLLTVVDGNRRWVTGSAHTFAVIEGEADTDISVMIPGRILYYAGSSDTDEVELGVRRNGEITAVRAARADSSTWMYSKHTPDGQMMSIARAVVDPTAMAIVPARSLAEIMATVTANPHPLDGHGYPLCLVTIDDEHLAVRIDWDELDAAHHHLEAEITGSDDCAAEPLAIARAANFLLGAPDETVNVEIAHFGPSFDLQNALILRTQSLVVHHFPPHPARLLRNSVENQIADAFGDLATVRDHDGDYVIRRHGHQILARLVHADPPTVQVFAVLLDDVDASTELLAEINDLNAGLTFVRLMLIERQVLAEVDLVAQTLDVEELHTAARTISHLAEQLAPIIATVHGGSVVDPSATRLAHYRNVVIEAEVSPGHWAQLHGPLASDRWNLPAEVYVITAHEPSGVPLSDATNSARNDQLAAAIIHRGGSFTDAVGRSPDGQHSEASYLAWNISRDTAISLGRQFDQDAIFALDATTVHLLPCIGDAQVDTWERSAMS